MARLRKTYAAEFKVRAVKMVTDQKLSVAEAARRLGVRENLLRLWKKAVLDRGSDAFPGHGHLSPADEELHRFRAEVHGRYGSPRMAAELNARGHACSENTVARLMRECGIRARTPRRRVRTTDSNHRLPVADNHLARTFDPTEPNTAWSADITYIPTREGWLYLAVVEDLFSRMIVGWSMDQTMESRLVVDALEMAVARRRPDAGLLAHSDRGSQYASDHYQRILSTAGIVWSMSEVGQCWDNAPVESFFGSLKRELAPNEVFATRDQARATIFEYLEVFYNRVRLHSSLGFVSPTEFERTYHQSHR